MAWNRRKTGTLVLVLLAAGGLAAWLALRREAGDTRFNGAYRLADGRLLFVSPREGKVLRYRMMDGSSRALWPAKGGAYEAGPGWAERRPVDLKVTFAVDPERGPTGLTWESRGAKAQAALRLDLPEAVGRFRSDGLELRAKLVTPRGPGPFPLVVFVHGSDDDSAVDGYFEPYLFAAHGIAALVYDKRGTGKSQGSYTQNFHVLARDVAAAVAWGRGRKEVDPTRVHLAGFSQGGWIAPLAALRIGDIRSVLVGFGTVVPVFDEDRWGYTYALQRKGFGPEAVAEADRLNARLAAIVDRGEDRWEELDRGLDAAQGRPWFRTVAGSDSSLGFVAGSRLPRWVLRLYAWWKLRPQEGEPFVERHYDPMSTLAALRSPSLWLLGGADSSLPTGWTLERLGALRQEGRPVEFEVYPRAEHGILRFEETKEGERRYLGYEPAYFGRMVAWVRRQSGLPEGETPTP